MKGQDKVFTIYWKSGEREVVSGPSISRAFSDAGLGSGSLDGIDFYVEGECDRYVWEDKNKSWWVK